MSLVIIEGMDKTGKTTICNYYIYQGYEYIHMTAPRKDISRAEYIAEMLTIIASTANKKVILDRSHFGELIWPYIFSRTPLLFCSDIAALETLCMNMHNGYVRKIYMYDPDTEAHKARMLKFKEPSYNYDLVYKLYDKVMREYNFKFLTFQEAEEIGWILTKD